MDEEPKKSKCECQCSTEKHGTIKHKLVHFHNVKTGFCTATCNCVAKEGKYICLKCGTTGLFKRDSCPKCSCDQGLACHCHCPQVDCGGDCGGNTACSCCGKPQTPPQPQKQISECCYAGITRCRCVKGENKCMECGKPCVVILVPESPKPSQTNNKTGESGLFLSKGINSPMPSMQGKLLCTCPDCGKESPKPSQPTKTKWCYCRAQDFKHTHGMPVTKEELTGALNSTKSQLTEEDRELGDWEKSIKNEIKKHLKEEGLGWDIIAPGAFVLSICKKQIRRLLARKDREAEERMRSIYKKVNQLDADKGAPDAWYEAIAKVKQILNPEPKD